MMNNNHISPSKSKTKLKLIAIMIRALLKKKIIIILMNFRRLLLILKHSFDVNKEYENVTVSVFSNLHLSF